MLSTTLVKRITTSMLMLIELVLEGTFVPERRNAIKIFNHPGIVCVTAYLVAVRGPVLVLLSARGAYRI